MGYAKVGPWVNGAPPALSAANLDQIETQYDEAAADLVTHAALTVHLVSGLIVIWHGTIANIPAGWIICDGGGGTPNLLTKFVQGVATAITDPGATGGEATHTLLEAEMPAHTHWVSMAAAASAGGAAIAPPGNEAQNSSSKGGGGAHQNEPTYYDVAFIMKT